MAGETTPVVSYPYLRNVLGMEVDDESMKSVPHARVTQLLISFLIRSHRLYSILKCSIVFQTPADILIERKFSFRQTWDSFTTCSLWYFDLGLFFIAESPMCY